jgi:hypothetical protein
VEDETACPGLRHHRPITTLKQVCRQSFLMRFIPMRLVKVRNRLFSCDRVVETGQERSQLYT